MGENISQSAFNDSDFERFEKELYDETDFLERLFLNGTLSKNGEVAGLEVEACLIDNAGTPQPRNDEYLKALNDPMVVHEISVFNIELNCAPEKLQGNALSNMEKSLTKAWQRAQDVAQKLDMNLIMIGILPTLEDGMLSLENMSSQERYKALNEQILHMRGGKPIKLDIEGKESLKSEHFDVMLESAATAFQIHLQVAPDKAHHFYNASKIISAPLIAIGANSPYLFGKDLWAETRIPLFEQSVSIGKWDYAERVTFGTRYLSKSLFGAFRANRERYPVIMPAAFKDTAENMRHLKLHNGTIWRWNRPLLGVDDDGTPHLRIEQRVLPSGPTVVDMIANMAFYYGLVYWLVENEQHIEKQIPFYRARDNFYEAAQNGLDAKIIWRDRQPVSIQDIILEELLPKMKQGLDFLGLNRDDIEKYHSLLKARVTSKQNGAEWQRRYVAKHGRDMHRLCLAYLRNQETGRPVHEWDLSP